MGRVVEGSADFRFSSQFSVLDMPPGLEGRFMAPQYFERDDLAERQSRIASLVSGQIIPRLMNLHRSVAASAGSYDEHPTEHEIAELSHLVLSSDPQAASAYIVALRDRGLAMDTLFVELLEPAARHLGEMWERDECDFIDVTLGVGRLQKLLAVFNCTHDLPAFNEKRSVLMLTVAGEQHGFGISMVEKFLEAGGWQVVSETEATPEVLAQRVRGRWFAAAGMTLSDTDNLDKVRAAISAIRSNSANPAIGVMVGGPVFNADPSLVADVGADGTAATAPTAVLMAQKLFDLGIRNTGIAAG